MPDSAAIHATAQQVELFIRRLNGLSTFPQVAAAAFGLLCEEPPAMDRLAALIQCDPALTARILSLAAREGVAQNGSTGRIDKAIEALPIETLREAVISIPVCKSPTAQTHELLGQTDRLELTRHALAVACASRRIAETALPEDYRSMAFAAGLLHDLGKLALAEVMPRSFAKLIQQARIEGRSLARVEQQHLGMDHTRIGKQLAEKWNLPEPIRAGIWLHHSEPALLVDRFPSARMAQAVSLANLLAKKCGLGDGDLYSPDRIRDAAFSLEIPMDAVERITADLPAEVEAQCKRLGIMPAEAPASETAAPIESYYQSVHTAASMLARENLSLASLTRSLRQTREQMELAQGFLASLEEPLTLERIVAAAVRRVHGRCQSACAIIVPMEGASASFYCHLTDRQGQQFVKYIYPAAEERLPDASPRAAGFEPAPPQLAWLFEKLEQKMDPSLTRLASLTAAGRRVGLLLAEFAGPVKASIEPDPYALLCPTAAGLIACAVQARQQKGLSEQMVELIGTMQETSFHKAQQEILEGVAEMAAGAAHELNNPLSVVSGRVQQLKAEETDPQRRELLELIETKSEEMARIVEDLARYARPRKPEKQIASLEEVVSAALQQLHEETVAGLDAIEIRGMETSPDVYVDLSQIAQAVAEVLKNALQSYPQDAGPVRIETAAGPSGFAVITVIDQGIGMEPHVLRQVFEPFFSHKAAGRRRGMGLARARRLITLNGGSIRIDSAPQKGARVTIQLPGV